jgi:hypothetical protein
VGGATKNMNKRQIKLVALTVLISIVACALLFIYPTEGERYKKCRKLLFLGINEEKALSIMGAPDSEYYARINNDNGSVQSDRVFIYKNPSHMPGPVAVYIDTDTKNAVLIKCGDE